MAAEKQRGVIYSALFHLLAFAIAFFGLPSFLDRQLPPEPATISVEILPITRLSNVPASKAKPAKKEKKTKIKKSSPPVKTAEPTPKPDEAVVPKAEKKKKKKKPKKKKKKKKAKKKKNKELDAILKAVRDTAQKEKDAKKKSDAQKAKTKSNSSRFDPNMQMSISEKDAIMSQISACWSVPAGAKDAQDLIVIIHAKYNHDGSYIQVKLSNEQKGRYGRDSFFRAAADSAIRAVKQCSPLKGLPLERYNGWREMELRFDPRDMLY